MFSTFYIYGILCASRVISSSPYIILVISKVRAIFFARPMLSFGRKKKKNQIFVTLSLFAVILMVGLVFPGIAHANYFVDGFKSMLYWLVFVPVGWVSSGAVTIFEYAVSTGVYGADGLFNKPSIYTNWKFVRDFFNLFFIFTLLYTAFTIVFQVASNYKKTLLSIVLAALFVNFSFPITRVIIDASNVPMYYFINQMTSASGSGPVDVSQSALGSALSASALQDKLIPGSSKSEKLDLAGIQLSQLIMAIVFLFIFSFTILILSVLLMIRLVALLMLIIFSSVGFAGSVIPGMQQYSSKWWDKLIQYALFGPTSMLLLYIATQFFTNISTDDTLLKMTNVTASNNASGGDFFSSMIMFSITIIMLFMVIAVAQTSSIMGAGMITSQGVKFMKWTARKLYNNPVGRGLGGGVKARAEKTKLGRFLKSPSGTEARIKGWTNKTGINPFGKSGREGARTELNKIHQQEVNKVAKEHKENKTNNSVLVEDLKSSDKVEREAAALALADNKAIDTAEKLSLAMAAVGDNADYAEAILKAASDKATSGLSASQLESMTQNRAFATSDAKGNPMKDPKTGKYIVDQDSANFKALKGKLKDSGQLKTLLEYEKARNIASGQKSTVALNNALQAVVEKLSSVELAKQTSLHGDSEFQIHLKNELSFPENRQYYEEAFKLMSKESRSKWIVAGNVP